MPQTFEPERFRELFDAMSPARKHGGVDDWVMHREPPEEDDIHFALLDSCAVVPITERLQFNPEEQQKAVRARFSSEYELDS